VAFIADENAVAEGAQLGCSDLQRLGASTTDAGL